MIPTKRAYAAYVNHVGFVTFMITKSMGIACTMFYGVLGNRMGAILTLVLTVVATKFQVMEKVSR